MRRGLDKCWYCRRSFLDDYKGGVAIYKIEFSNSDYSAYPYLVVDRKGMSVFVCTDCHKIRSRSVDMENQLTEILKSKIEDEKGLVESEYYKGRVSAFQFVLDCMEEFPWVALGIDKQEFVQEFNRRISSGS